MRDGPKTLAIIKFNRAHKKDPWFRAILLKYIVGLWEEFKMYSIAYSLAFDSYYLANISKFNGI